MSYWDAIYQQGSKYNGLFLVENRDVWGTAQGTAQHGSQKLIPGFRQNVHVIFLLTLWPLISSMVIIWHWKLTVPASLNTTQLCPKSTPRMLTGKPFSDQLGTPRLGGPAKELLAEDNLYPKAVPN